MDNMDSKKVSQIGEERNQDINTLKDINFNTNRLELGMKKKIHSRIISGVFNSAVTS